MNICKPLFAIIAASALSGLAPQVIADPDHNHHKCRAKITSTTITIENKVPAWYVSGDCLDKITNVSVAKDDGAGFEDLPFTLTMAPNNPDAKPSLLITLPLVPRMAGVGGIHIGSHELNIGQYLLQVKSCKIVESGEKCKIHDEAFMPGLGDQTTISLLMELMEKFKKLFPR